MRVERGGRLVEDRDLRPLHQDLGEPEALAHALREGADPRPADIGEPDPFERCGKARVDLVARQSGEPGGIGQVVARRKPVVEADLVGQVADPPLDFERLAQRVEPGDLGASAGRLGEAEQHQDRRRLARAVRAEDADDLAGADLEIDMVDRQRGAVALGQPRRPDHHLARHIAVLNPRRHCSVGQRRPKRATANTTTKSAIAMMPIATAPHSVEVSTVMRKLADSDSPPAALARIVVW